MRSAAGETAGRTALGQRRAFAGDRQGHPANIPGHAHDHLLPPPHEDGGDAADHGERRGSMNANRQPHLALFLDEIMGLVCISVGTVVWYGLALVLGS